MYRSLSKLLVALCLPLLVGLSSAADAPPLTDAPAKSTKPAKAGKAAHVPVQGPEQELVMFVG